MFFQWLDYTDFKDMMMLLSVGDFSNVGLEFKGAKMNFFDQSIAHHMQMMEKYTVVPSRYTVYKLLDIPVEFLPTYKSDTYHIAQ